MGGQYESLSANNKQQGRTGTQPVDGILLTIYSGKLLKIWGPQAWQDSQWEAVMGCACLGTGSARMVALLGCPARAGLAAGRLASCSSKTEAPACLSPASLRQSVLRKIPKQEIFWDRVERCCSTQGPTTMLTSIL
jgi:hypothetical protein